jgi:hypothetical protein
MGDMVKNMLLKILVEVLGKLITPDLVEKFKTDVILYVAELAKQSDNKIDDSIVEILADALGVKLPS